MAKHSSLPVLIDLARDGAKQASEQLQVLTSEKASADEQLTMLLVYRQDYAERLHKTAETGLSASNYHNFRQFIATLDEAITQQNRVIAQIEVRIEQGRQRWSAETRRASSFEALLSRDRRQQIVRENRAEQRASDEISANLYRRALHSH